MHSSFANYSDYTISDPTRILRVK